MKYIFTKQTETNGTAKLIVESEDDGGARTRLGARGIPAALAGDAEYLESLKTVTLKEFLADARMQPADAPATAEIGVIEQ